MFVKSYRLDPDQLENHLLTDQCQIIFQNRIETCHLTFDRKIIFSFDVLKRVEIETQNLRQILLTDFYSCNIKALLNAHTSQQFTKILFIFNRFAQLDLILS